MRGGAPKCMKMTAQGRVPDPPFHGMGNSMAR
jgi:hypothetical protein